MKAVSFDDSTWEVFGKELSVHDKLPAKTFEIEEQPFGRIVFKERENLKVVEKLYGNYEKTANHIIKGFENINRNMGVILSGDKGLGKTITAKLICQKLNSKGYPVIVINKAFDNMDKIISSLDQEVIILFDEFDKMFASKDSVYDEDNDDTRHSRNMRQMQLLSLLDGTNNNKKLFILTCNDIWEISQLFINRPGRCHYHIRFDYPQEEEINEYLNDNILPEYQKEINNILNFSTKMRLNYDCLRAICFEINMGYTFKETIDILNIINLDDQSYTIDIELETGEKFSLLRNLNLFNPEKMQKDSINWYDHATDTRYTLICDYDKLYYDKKNKTFTVNDAKVRENQSDNTIQVKNISIKSVSSELFKFAI